MNSSHYSNAVQAIAPYINEYNNIGECFCPYIMRISTPDYRSRVINTDSLGFRYTIMQDGKVISPFQSLLSLSEPLTLCLGASALFGVGTSSDSTTIPSYLDTFGIQNPLNAGIRACNSTQELNAFSFLFPFVKDRLERVIIFSGINNLTLDFVGSPALPYLNSLFNSESIKLALNKSNSLRYLSKLLFVEILSRVKSDRSNKRAVVPRMPASFHTTAMLEQVKALCDQICIPVYFFMQPIASVCKTSHSSEEDALLNSLRTIDSQYLRSRLLDHIDEYGVEIEKHCSERGIYFLDVNDHLANSHDSWYFVDSIHLSDDGSKACAKIISQYIKKHS
jgi:hypothetical protein